MAMLINGTWSEIDKIIQNGEYVRQRSAHDEVINQDTIRAISSHPGRFVLIASWSCPWSHRTMLMRKLKGLESYIPMHMTGGKRLQGYSANYGKKWKIPGTNTEIVHLHQLYSLNNPNHTGRPTVPVLWDSQEQKIISDESAKIMRAFDQVRLSGTTIYNKLHYTPVKLIDSINRVNQRIYENLSNAVYCAGFAETQSSYNEAVGKVFNMLNELEMHFTKNRYLLGEIITESDWRLFPTLVRFDLDYYLYCRCSVHRLTDYPNLWGYARDLYSISGVKKTIDFQAINLSNFLNKKVIAKLPLIDWLEPHDREKIGEAKVASITGGYVNLDLLNSERCDC